MTANWNLLLCAWYSYKTLYQTVVRVGEPSDFHASYKFGFALVITSVENNFVFILCSISILLINNSWNRPTQTRILTNTVLQLFLYLWMNPLMTTPTVCRTDSNELLSALSLFYFKMSACINACVKFTTCISHVKRIFRLDNPLMQHFCIQQTFGSNLILW
jgi:hypothetical protein